MDAQTLSTAMGCPLARATEMLPGMENAMRAANINTPLRAAHWCAQIGHESVGLQYMEEIASGAAYNGRADLGNTQPGDGPRYKGSGPIQLTGRNNFRAFTRWANAQGHTTIDFEAQPQLVRSNPKWGFLAASWYWTVARPQLNSLCDADNLDGVTRAINGGTNGITDRRTRLARCKTLGTRLLPSGGAPVARFHPMKPDTYTVSSGYGPRWGTHHNGLDFAAPVGTPIYAPADGTVVQGSDRAQGSVSGFGSWIWLDCQSSVGKDFIFGHVQHSGIKVRRGQSVKAGQQIGVSGNEGQTTGPHLHFEVWGSPGRTGGRHEDPAAWLKGASAPGGSTHTTTPPKENTVTDYARLGLEQLAGSGHKDGEPTFTGWGIEDLITKGRENLQKYGSATVPQMLAIAHADELRAIINEGK
ncbi:peptidoglycan DD-metalloendopeptidase family protein [Corynebacterium sp. AOP40-4SA-5]|uniref:peptidoglycan DD-metalloendopeptidase family protein n=1 Tax=Corynebacterium sp. AOP40-4SA-5 TaxID=3457678 RepID=UPI004034F320